MAVKYPDVTVQLSDMDGNVFAVIGQIRHALTRAHGGRVGDEWTSYARAAGSYDEVLTRAREWVNVE